MVARGSPGVTPKTLAGLRSLGLPWGGRSHFQATHRTDGQKPQCLHIRDLGGQRGGGSRSPSMGVSEDRGLAAGYPQSNRPTREKRGCGTVYELVPSHTQSPPLCVLWEEAAAQSSLRSRRGEVAPCFKGMESKIVTFITIAK